MAGQPGRSGTNSKGSGARKHRPPDKRLIQKLQMMKMIERGWNKTQIAAQFKVHPTTISRDWKEVIEEMSKEAYLDRDHYVATAEAGYRETMREAWEAWDRSKNDATKKVEKEVPKRTCPVCQGETVNKKGLPCPTCDATGEVGGIIEEVRTVEGRLPENDYLRTILDCWAKICQLRGLNAPKELNISGQVAAIDWRAVAAEIRGETEPKDVIDSQIFAPLTLPAPATTEPANGDAHVRPE